MTHNSIRLLLPAIALGLSLAVCACNRPPPAAELGQDEAPTLENATATAAPRVYEPMSKTAEAMTGPLEFTEIERADPNVQRLKVIAGLGHTWEITMAQAVSASDKVGSQQWISFLPIAADAQVYVYAVDDESVQAKAINGGICGPEGTGFMAFSEAPSANGDMQMSMAAFKNVIWPPPSSAAPQPCGTFTYIMKKADAPGGTP